MTGFSLHFLPIVCLANRLRLKLTGFVGRLGHGAHCGRREIAQTRGETYKNPQLAGLDASSIPRGRASIPPDITYSDRIYLTQTTHRRYDAGWRHR